MSDTTDNSTTTSAEGGDLNLSAGTEVEGGAEGAAAVLTPMEQRASDRGWTPETEWQGDAEEWVDARTYVRQGELMDKISKQSNQLKKQGQAIDEFKVLQTSMEQRALEKAKVELLEEKQNAYEGGDFGAVVEIEEKIKSTDKQIDAAKVPTTTAPSPEEFAQAFNSWKPNNAWYGVDDVMTTYSDSVGSNYAKANPEASPEEVFSHVDITMKSKFPAKFANARRSATSAVGTTSTSGNAGGTRGQNAIVAGLNEDEKRAGQRYVSIGLFKNMHEYATSLRELED